MCREALGSSKQPAAYLTPVPEGSVVYGSGSSSVILTKASSFQTDRPAEIPRHVNANGGLRGDWLRQLQRHTDKAVFQLNFD